MRTRLAVAGRDLSLPSMMAAAPAFAQKQGGTLRISHRDNPPSASIHEESTISVNQPFMAVFNNLVLFDPNEKVNSPDNIVPDLAESWSWNDDKTKLTFKLRQGVKWHDGKPFTAADVKCTWDALIGKGDEKLDIIRKNPRKIWYINLKDVTTNGDNEVTFNLGRPQPSFLTHARRRLLAGLFLPRAGPRHALQADRHRPVQGRRVQAQRIDQAGARIPTTGRRAGPISTPSTGRSCPTAARACWASVAGEFDMTFDSDVTFPLLKDVKAQKPDAVCEARPTNVSSNLLVNRDKPPFDNAADPPGHGAGARQPGLRRHPEPGQRSRRRGHAAAAGRRLGHAEGDAAEPARPFARHREEPRRGAQDHGEGWATAPTSRSRSRSRPATSRSIAIRR